MEKLESKYNQLVEAGLSHQLAADSVIKKAESKEEFLFGLKLLCDAHMDTPPHKMPLLYQVQRAYHRYIRRLFGVRSITEAIIDNLDISPVMIAKVKGEGPSVISYKVKRKQKSVESSKSEQNINDPELAEFLEVMRKQSESAQKLGVQEGEKEQKSFFEQYMESSTSN